MRTLDEWLAHQQAQHSRTIDLGLERVAEVALRLGLLPAAMPVVLVGGTNGKGSTVAFLTAIAREAGLRVGTYTSPHLVRYAERVALDGEPVDEQLLLESFERIEVERREVPLTFFEYGTLAAYDIFRHAAVDLAVVEVGLGGRLDATNIVDADVAVVCSIGLDHTDWLGPTLEDIGREKAGIFRPGRAAILGSAAMPDSVLQGVTERGAIARSAGRDFHVELGAGAVTGSAWAWHGWAGDFTDLPVPGLSGRIQYDNAAAAIAAFTALLEARPALLPGGLDPGCLRRALASVRLRGRFQRIPGQPEWILDVAHNEAAARVLADQLALLPSPGRTLAVAGILADKDVAAIGRVLAPVVDGWILCGLDGPRSLDAEELRARLPPECRSLALVPDVAAGCGVARALARPDDRILVLGSFHTVGPALEWLGV